MKRRIVFSNKLIVGIIVASLILFSLNLETEIATSPSSSYHLMKVFDRVLENPFSFDLTPHEPIEIDSDSDFISYGFPGSGTEIDPYIIGNYEIISSSDNGIYIKGTTRYFVIRNSYVDAGNYGIYINNVADGTASIINNTCTNNTVDGIYLYYSSGSTLTNNTCTNNKRGIHLGGFSGSTLTNNTCSFNYLYGICLWYSSGSTLTDNTCTNNYYYGIYCKYSSGSTLTDNTCTNNNYRGIHLGDSSGCTLTNNTCTNNENGIGLQYSSDATLTNNNCTSNLYGIFLYSSDSCLITDNFLQENEDYGIYLDYNSYKNIIYHNYFIFNNLGGTSQAIDNGLTNTWYNISINKGNYWTDWSGSGAYAIEGSAGASDSYPLSYEDTDGDGLADILEIIVYHTNPSLNDTDGDFMPDGWEVNNNLNPLVDDSFEDADSDGLTNLLEYQHNTDPNDTDTDSDGLSDGEEVHTYNTNPLNDDTDSDGLSDGEEVHTYNTNPLNDDTDNDGLSDGEEVNTYGTDPNNVDSDGDEYSDFEEINAGKDPLDPTSHPLSKTERIIFFIFLPVLAVAILAFATWKYFIPYTRNTIIPRFTALRSEKEKRRVETLAISVKTDTNFDIHIKTIQKRVKATITWSIVSLVIISSALSSFIFIENWFILIICGFILIIGVIFLIGFLVCFYLFINSFMKLSKYDIDVSREARISGITLSIGIFMTTIVGIASAVFSHEDFYDEFGPFLSVRISAILGLILMIIGSWYMVKVLKIFHDKGYFTKREKQYWWFLISQVILFVILIEHTIVILNSTYGRVHLSINIINVIFSNIAVIYFIVGLNQIYHYIYPISERVIVPKEKPEKAVITPVIVPPQPTEQISKDFTEVPVSTDEVVLIHCSSCGEKVTKSLKFCPSCGTTFEE